MNVPTGGSRLYERGWKQLGVGEQFLEQPLEPLSVNWRMQFTTEVS